MQVTMTQVLRHAEFLANLYRYSVNILRKLRQFGFTEQVIFEILSKLHKRLGECNMKEFSDTTSSIKHLMTGHKGNSEF